MPIRKRVDLTGKSVVFVTTTITNWEPVFSNKSIAEVTLSQLLETSDHFHVSIIAYVLMPSHLHAVLGFQQIESLSKFMQSFKSLAARKVEKIMDESTKLPFLEKDKFRLWKPRFDDLIITSEKQFRIKVDYIHMNPVKSGLVNLPEGFEYSSASDWISDKTGMIPIDKDFSFLK